MSKNDQLFEAVKKGDVVTIRRLEFSKLWGLTRGVYVNATDEHGRTPLHHAAMTRSREIVELLIQKGANVNARDEKGVAPLSLSSQRDVAEAIIRAGGDVNDMDSCGKTPLADALYDHREDVAILLIEHGADVNKQYADTPPLVVAISQGLTDVATLLIKEGADINTSQSALYNETCVTPLHTAIEKGYIDLAQLLIEKGAKVNIRKLCPYCAHHRSTPLRIAVDQGYMDLAMLLIERGAVDDKIDRQEILLRAATSSVATDIRDRIGKGVDLQGVQSGETTESVWNPPALSGPEEYVRRCLEPEFREEAEKRTFRDDPAFVKVLEPLNAQKYSVAIEMARRIIPKHSDFDLVHKWLGYALRENGFLAESRKAFSEGLKWSKRKLIILTDMGETEFESGNIDAAVFAWSQAIHCLSKSPIDYNAYLLMSCVAKGLQLDDVAAAFLARVDKLRAGQVRLEPQKANRLTTLARQSNSESIKEVLTQLRKKYL